MVKIIKGNKPIPQDNDCHCGKPLRVNDPAKKKILRIVKKK